MIHSIFKEKSMWPILLILLILVFVFIKTINAGNNTNKIKEDKKSIGNAINENLNDDDDDNDDDNDDKDLEKKKSKKELKNPYFVDKILLKKFEGKNLVEFLIVGSGPAGYSSALYATRLGHLTLCVEGEIPGGALMKTEKVENWPGILNKTGPEIIEDLKTQAYSFGARYVDQDVINIDFSEWPYKTTLKNGIEIYAMGIIMATGSSPRKLGIPGEKEYWGKGVTTCAICDAALHKNKVVALVGGGDSACEEALQLVPYASEIFVFVRKDAMRASKIMQDYILQEPKIKILYESEITEIKGDLKKVTKIIYTEKGKTKEKDVSGVFIAIGHLPNNQLIKDIFNLKEDEKASCLDRTQKTTVPFLYIAGDLENEYEQAAVASSGGVIAALDFDRDIKSTQMKFSYLKEYSKSFLDINNVDAIFANQLKTIEDSKKNTEVKSKKESFNDIINLNNKNDFENAKKKYPFFVIDFNSTWCPPCKTLKKNIKDLLKQKDYSFPVFSVNVDEFPEITEEYEIYSIPVLMLFENGKMIKRLSGSKSIKELEKLFGPYSK